MYAATGDPACRAKVDSLVHEWAKCIDADGYFYYSRNPRAPHYTYEKMIGGLLDAHQYCGNQEALAALSRITDWAIKNLDQQHRFYFQKTEGSIEWYTLSEQLYRAYLVTGDAKYKSLPISGPIASTGTFTPAAATSLTVGSSFTPTATSMPSAARAWPIV